MAMGGGGDSLPRHRSRGGLRMFLEAPVPGLWVAPSHASVLDAASAGTGGVAALQPCPLQTSWIVGHVLFLGPEEFSSSLLERGRQSRDESRSIVFFIRAWSR